ARGMHESFAAQKQKISDRENEFAKEIKRIHGEIEIQKELNRELRRKNESILLKYEEMKRELLDLEFARKEIARKNIDLHSAADKVTEYKELAAQLEGRVHRLEKEAAEFTAEIAKQEELKEQIGRMTIELEKAQEKLASERTRHNQEIESLNSVIGDLEARIAEKDETIAGQSGEIINLKFEKDVLNRQFESKDKKIEELSETIALRDKKIAALEAEIEKLRDENATIAGRDEENRQLRLRISKMEAVRIADESTAKKLQERNRELNINIESLRNSLADAEEKLAEAELAGRESATIADKLREELRAAKNESLINSKKSEELRRRLKEIEAEAHAVEAENEQLAEKMSQLDRLTTEKQELLRLLGDAERTARQARNECVIKENMLAEEHIRTARLRQRAAELESVAAQAEESNHNITSCEFEIRRLRSIAESRSAEAARLSRRVDTLESELSRSRRDVDNIEEEFSRLTARFRQVDGRRREAIDQLESIMNKIARRL
ncbi:MAG: hypothetical protein ACOCX7_01545, partial [Bacteroidota bacterium]